MKTDKWFKENGFVHSKHFDSFGHYCRLDPSDNRIGQKIKWHYNDSEDRYYVKWQLWTGINSFQESKKWQPLLSKRDDGVFWECETDNEVFWDKIDSGYSKAIEYIKNHSEEKFELMRDYIEKKQKDKLQS